MTPLLAAAGRASTAIDMEGHGLSATLPASALARPFDAAAFATERSPHADVTLASAAARLVGQIETVGRPVVLVGHSMGGHVVTAAAQRAPQLVERLVYVCAFMPASGAAGGAYVQSSENEGELVGPLVVADPGVVGAIRLDVRTPDPAYRAGLRDAFYGDLPAEVADGAIRLLSTDLPLGIAGGATDLTAEAWGSIPRTYVRCSGGPRDPSGPADALHRRGRRGLPRERDPRRRSRHRALAVHVGARPRRGGDPGGVIGVQSLGRVGIWSRELRFGDAADARDACRRARGARLRDALDSGRRWRRPARGRRRSARRDASGRDRDGHPQRVRPRPRGRRARPRRDRRAHPGRFLLGIGIGHAKFLDEEQAARSRHPLDG